MSDVLERPATLAPVPGDPGRWECFIPTPCVQNHAGFLAQLPGGDLGCVWFGGTQEGIPDISVHFSRLAAGADRWTEAVRPSDDPTRTEQNPLLFPTPDGTALWLLWMAQRGGNQDTAMVRRRVSRDAGRSWGPIETLIPERPGFGTFIRSPIVANACGEWLLPIWRCAKPRQGAWTGELDTSSVLISADAGATWREVEVPGSTGCVHMSVVRWGGRLVAFFRSRWADRVYRSVSADEGHSSSAPERTPLPNNNSSVMALVLRNANFDPQTDLEVCARTAQAPLVMAIAGNRPQRTLAEVVEAAKARPREWSIAITSLGAASHLATIELNRRTGANLEMVAYRGTQPALQDLLAGNVQLLLDPSFNLLPHREGGWLRALGIASRERSPLAPDVPTMAEAGLPGYAFQSWYGVWAPKGTPDEIVQRLNDLMQETMRDPAIVSHLTQQVLEPVAESIADTRRFIANEIARAAELLRSVNFQPE